MPSAISFKPPGMAALLAATLVFILAMGWWTTTISANACDLAGDCTRYIAMAEGFRDHHYPQIEKPFNVRILTPLIAATIPGDITDGFRAINFVSFLILVVSWYLLSKTLKLPAHAFAFLIAWFLIHPLGIQFYHHIPQLVDPLAYALMAITIYLYLAGRHALFFLTVFLALFEKESFIFVLIVASATELYSSRRGRNAPESAYRFAALSILVLLAYQVAIHISQQALFPPSTEGNALKTILFWWRKLRHDPNRLIVWMAAFFCATGTLTALLPGRRSPPLSDLESRQVLFLKLGAVGFAILGLLGGTDMSRIIFNGILFIYPAVLVQARPLVYSWKIFPVYGSCLLVALGYPLFFPSAFEYGYYGSAKAGASLAFLLITAALTLLLRKVLTRLPGTASS